MTEETFLVWLNRYANAVKELSWNGSQLTSVEIAEHKKFWTAMKKEARAKLVSIYRELSRRHQ